MSDLKSNFVSYCPKNIYVFWLFKEKGEILCFKYESQPPSSPKKGSKISKMRKNINRVKHKMFN